MSEIQIIPLCDEYRKWANELLIRAWGDIRMVSRGVVHHGDKLPGFVALLNSTPQGLVTYNIVDEQCEIVTLNSLTERQGIGSNLINTVHLTAKEKGCKRLWLITTNDNTYALKFYQKYGFKIAAYHLGSVEKLRKLKPQIPYWGMDGIPIKDEIELEIVLS